MEFVVAKLNEWTHTYALHVRANRDQRNDRFWIKARTERRHNENSRSEGAEVAGMPNTMRARCEILRALILLGGGTIAAAERGCGRLLDGTFVFVIVINVDGIAFTVEADSASWSARASESTERSSPTSAPKMARTALPTPSRDCRVCNIEPTS